MDLHGQCTVLDSKLGESHIAFSDILKLVLELEYKITSMQEEIALKEKTINVDLESIIEESRKQEERFIIFPVCSQHAQNKMKSINLYTKFEWKYKEYYFYQLTITEFLVSQLFTENKFH